MALNLKNIKTKVEKKKIDLNKDKYVNTTK
jgi:hypothetical protein